MAWALIGQSLLLVAIRQGSVALVLGRLWLTIEVEVAQGREAKQVIIMHECNSLGD